MKNELDLFSVLRFDGHGLIPAVIQDTKSKQVLTLCYLNKVALKESLNTGVVYVYRRSMKRVMKKGETSGNIQRIRRVLVDCEGNSLLIEVSQRVAACHAGYFSCYFRKSSGKNKVKIMGRRVFDPSKIYRRSK